jgi:hypothetical protein
MENGLYVNATQERGGGVIFGEEENYGFRLLLEVIFHLSNHVTEL